MNIFRFEWRRQLGSTIIWTFSIITLLFLFMMMFPIIAEQREAYKNIMESFPPAARRLMGLMETDITTISGFYSYTFLFMMIIGGVQASRLGLTVLSEEMRNRTTDFLLAKPVKRIHIINAKLLAAVVHLILTNVIVTSSTLILFGIYFKGEYQIDQIFLVSSSLFPVQGFFLSLGALLAVVMKKVKVTMPIALGVTFFFYFFQVISTTLSEKTLTYMTPFAYYSPDLIFQDKGFDLSYLGVNIILIAVFLAIAYWGYQKKNMPSL